MPWWANDRLLWYTVMSVLPIQSSSTMSWGREAQQLLISFHQRRSIAKYIRDLAKDITDRNDSISIGQSLQLADEILSSDLCKAQNNNFKLTQAIKRMIMQKLQNNSDSDLDVSTTGSLSRENSGDSALSQSDSEPLPPVPLSQERLPRQAISPWYSLSPEVPRLC